VDRDFEAAARPRYGDGATPRRRCARRASTTRPRTWRAWRGSLSWSTTSRPADAVRAPKVGSSAMMRSGKPDHDAGRMATRCCWPARQLVRPGVLPCRRDRASPSKLTRTRLVPTPGPTAAVVETPRHDVSAVPSARTADCVFWNRKRTRFAQHVQTCCRFRLTISVPSRRSLPSDGPDAWCRGWSAAYVLPEPEGPGDDHQLALRGPAC